MRVLDVPDQVPVADGVAHAPAGGVEGFADGADADGVAGDGRVEGCDARERRVVGEVLVDFVGEDDDVVAGAQGADGEELGGREDFTEGVVAALCEPEKKKKGEKKECLLRYCSIRGADLRGIHNLGPRERLATVCLGRLSLF